MITSVDVDIEREYSLLTSHSLSASTTGTWYNDSGASNHMTGVLSHIHFSARLP